MDKIKTIINTISFMRSVIISGEDYTEKVQNAATEAIDMAGTLRELDKQDLVSMVKGTVPYYDIFDHPGVKSCGHYVGGMSDKWVWETSALEKLHEDHLWEIYGACKNSWPQHG